MIQSIDYSFDKSKYEIKIYVMMIICKYFELNNDYINIMKLNKKYKQLNKEYTYNPISNTSLFKNMTI